MAGERGPGTLLFRGDVACAVPTLVLAHDHFLKGEAKTAEALIRYGRDPVVAVVDRQAREPASAKAVVGEPGAEVPVVPDLAAGLELGADRLVIGVAPVGGQLPTAWRGNVLAALEAGLEVASGMHEFLAEDDEMAQAAKAGGAHIHDVRRPPPGKPIYSGQVLDLPCTVVLTVGTDCSSGKMTTSVELVRALKARGVQAAFAATGQTGILVGCDSGVVVDAVPADFVAGWSERLVLEAHEATGAEIVVVEGQGAITHPAYAGVSLGLLHGASPQLCVLCHDASRKQKTTTFHHGRTFPVHDPSQEWRLIRELASAIRTPALLGLSIMRGASQLDALSERFNGAPAVDVLDGGAQRLAEALEARL